MSGMDRTFEMLLLVGALCIMAWGCLRISRIFFERKYGKDPDDR